MISNACSNSGTHFGVCFLEPFGFCGVNIYSSRDINRRLWRCHFTVSQRATDNPDPLRQTSTRETAIKLLEVCFGNMCALIECSRVDQIRNRVTRTARSTWLVIALAAPNAKVNKQSNNEMPRISLIVQLIYVRIWQARHEWICGNWHGTRFEQAFSRMMGVANGGKGLPKCSKLWC